MCNDGNPGTAEWCGYAGPFVPWDEEEPLNPCEDWPYGFCVFSVLEPCWTDEDCDDDCPCTDDWCDPAIEGCVHEDVCPSGCNNHGDCGADEYCDYADGDCGLIPGDVYHLEADKFPVPVPDHPSPGIASTLQIDDGGIIAEANVKVMIAHPFAGDLMVSLSNGQTAVSLHNQSGGAQDNLYRVYDLADSPDGPEDMSVFHGESVAGEWTLTVQDWATGDEGVLEDWRLYFVKTACNSDGECADEETCDSCSDDCICLDGDVCVNGVCLPCQAQCSEDELEAADWCAVTPFYLCGKTFASFCELKCHVGLANCPSISDCSVSVLPGACKCGPCGECPDAYEPLCGTDGYTHWNECDLLVCLADPEVEIECKGECPDPPVCPACPQDCLPVCGKLLGLHKYFRNSCFLECAGAESAEESACCPGCPQG